VERITRRGLIAGASAMLAGFSVPKLPLGPAKDNAALWVVFIAGNCRTPVGFKAFEVGQESAKRAGFDVLDSMHNVRERSKFLARKEVDLAYAREQEKLAVYIGPITDLGKSDLQGVAEGVVALWVEVA